MSEAGIGEIRTLTFMGETLDPKETCSKPILSQEWMTSSKISGRRRCCEWKPYTKSYVSCKEQTLRNQSDGPPLRNTQSMLTSSTPSKRGLSDGDLEQSLLRTIQSREVGMANKTEAKVELEQETCGEEQPSNSCDDFARSYYTRGDEALLSCPIQTVTLHQEEVVVNQIRGRGSTNHNYPGTLLRLQQRLEKSMRTERK